jgi:hypothetical protein
MFIAEARRDGQFASAVRKRRTVLVMMEAGVVPAGIAPDAPLVRPQGSCVLTLPGIDLQSSSSEVVAPNSGYMEAECGVF